MEQTPSENAADAVGMSVEPGNLVNANAPLAEPQAQMPLPEEAIDEPEQEDTTSEVQNYYLEIWETWSEEEVMKDERFFNWRRWSAFHLVCSVPLPYLLHILSMPSAFWSCINGAFRNQGEWANISWYEAARKARPELPAWPVVIYGPLERTFEMMQSCLKEHAKCEPWKDPKALIRKEAAAI